MLGGWCGVMWVFMRAVALHLQICWQVVIGNMFMWGALAAGWGIPAIALVIGLMFSGVSFRFGDTCHINHKNSLASFWIPLLVFAGITVIIQFSTFAYCIKVYLASLGSDDIPTHSSGTYSNSMRGTVSPGQAYRRVRRVMELQWRGIAIVLLIVADVVFFAIVFVFMDDLLLNAVKTPQKSQAWLQCLIQTGGNKNKCLPYASTLRVNEATIMAVLILLSLNGIWCLFLLGRFSMFTGWKELVMKRFKPNNEFVSADVKAIKDPASYEMLSRERDTGKTPEPLLPYTHSPLPTPLSPPTPAAAPRSGRTTPDYFGREARYKSPSRSFSNPRPPNTYSGGSGYSTKISSPYMDNSPNMTQTTRLSPSPTWDHTSSQARPFRGGVNPLSMNKI
jgi:hypothetical protein